MAPDQKSYTLFGGEKGWQASDWTSSDDRVRGGKSQSYLECKDKIGRFYGTLDIKTLGGAGFASQRTTGDDREWDLSDYVGIQISIAKGDKKRYTFNLKDELLEKDPETGREKATVSYECDFELPPQTKPGDTEDKSVFIPWESFTPTYRGKPKKDAEPLDRKKIKRLSIMMRSFFGSQEGEFSLSMTSIKALSKVPSADAPIFVTEPEDLEKGLPERAQHAPPFFEPDGFRLNGWRAASVRIPKTVAYLILGSMALVALHSLQGALCHRP